MGNLATIPAGRSSFSLAPQTLDEAMAFANMMAKSPFVPKDYQGQPGNVLVAVQWGAEIGLQPLQAMQNLAVVNGRPSIWGDAMIALVRGSGLLESIQEDIAGDEATCTVKRRGEPTTSRTFTMEDAKKAGLAGKQGPWTQYPKRMLQMRARAWALRDVFPDVLKGVYIAEEARDMQAEKDITSEGETIAETKPATSRAERTKQALASRKKVHPAAEFGPDLAEVIAAISAAETPEAMQSAAELAARLTSDDDKTEAGKRYKARLHELRDQQDDNLLREVEQAERQSAGKPLMTMTYAEVAGRITRAANEDDLAAAADLIQHVESATQRDELSGVYKSKAAEFKNK